MEDQTVETPLLEPLSTISREQEVDLGFLSEYSEYVQFQAAQSLTQFVNGPCLHKKNPDLIPWLITTLARYTAHNASQIEQQEQERLQKIDALLFENRNRLDYLKFINPTNGPEEKRKFFEALERNEVYNPQFEYNYLELVSDLQKVAEVLQEIRGLMKHLGLCEMRTLFERELEIQEYTLEFLCVVLEPPPQYVGIALPPNDPRRFNDPTPYAHQIFGWIDDDLLQEAYSLLKPMPPNGFFPTEGETLNQDAVRERAEAALQEIGADDWTFAFHEDPTAGPVARASEKTVYFMNREEYPESLVKLLIAHEIKGHVVHERNALEYGWKIYQSGIGAYESLLEGFALYQEREVNPDLEVRVAFYYVAVNFAITHSLHETFLHLREHGLPDETAYALAVKVKRGMNDTSQPGSWLKDKVYFEGLRLMDSYTPASREVVAMGKFDPQLFAAAEYEERA